MEEKNQLYTCHKTVLLNEVVNIIRDQSFSLDQFVFADMTFGGGGHSLKVIDSFDRASVVAFDQDREAYKNGQQLIADKGLSQRIDLIHTNFEFFDSFVEQSKLLKEQVCFDAALLDIGVSNHHFSSSSRGFSFQENAKLDMRMNVAGNNLTAEDIVNDYSLEQLQEIFKNYGEERFGDIIARNIVDQRNQQRIETTKDLENIIFHSYPKRFRYGKVHPATKCFQALRIEVNDELGVLERVLPKLFAQLCANGVLIVITFHSLEDRIVKHYFKKCVKELKLAEFINKKVIVPSTDEISMNKKARSAKLRAIRKF